MNNSIYYDKQHHTPFKITQTICKSGSTDKRTKVNHKKKTQAVICIKNIRTPYHFQGKTALYNN